MQPLDSEARPDGLGARNRIQADAAEAWAETKFERLFRMSPACTLLLRLPEFQIEDANEAALRVSGYSLSELVGLPGGELWVFPEDRDRLVARILKEGRISGAEGLFRIRSGELKVGRIATEPLDMPDGPRLLVMIEDITEERRLFRLYAALSMANQSLVRVRTRKELFRNICRSLVEGGGFWAAWIAEPEPGTDRFVHVASFGGHPDWTENLVVHTVESLPTGRGTMGRAYRGGRPVIANDFDSNPMMVPWREEARTYEFKAVGSFPLKTGTGKTFGVLCTYAREAGFFGEKEISLLEEICSDVTFALEDMARRDQQRLLEERLRESHKMESLGTLAGGVAHDMNNVLGAILGQASVEAERASGASRRAMEAIVQACVRGREVVQGLLAFSRRDLEEPRPVDLNQLVREVATLLGHTTLQRIRISLDLDPGLPLVQGDAGALNHAIMNICVNALDAMPRGGTLAMRTRRDEGNLACLAIEDDGEGMAEEVLQRATEPFFTTKPAGKGTGLGLATVYGTVQAHHGSLDLASAPGQGTRVILTLPGTTAPPAAAAREEEPPGEGSLDVLVVDDDDMLRETVQDVLTWKGHRAASASGGQEALDLLAGGADFDWIILDMNMPGMSGAEALPRILELRPGQKVLIATGHTDACVKELLASHPNLRSIPKPFSAAELERKLKFS